MCHKTAVVRFFGQIVEEKTIARLARYFDDDLWRLLG